MVRGRGGQVDPRLDERGVYSATTRIRPGCPGQLGRHVRWHRGLYGRLRISRPRFGVARYDSTVHTLQRHGSVQPDDLAASLADYVVIDVRDRSQFELGHIPGSTHVPIDRLRAGWELPDKRVPIAVLGEGDTDAEAAAVLLAGRGRDAITISGGAQAWRAAGRCFVTNHP